ncbi:MAG: hypothetical protein ACFCU4_08055 [Puniceicoccaceae bacterium]
MEGQIAGSQPVARRMMITITNHGPGKTKAHILALRKTSLRRRLFRRTNMAILLPDNDQYSGRLPADLDVGDRVNLTFRPNDDIFILNDDYDQIGISDPFGLTHWSSRNDYRKAKASYIEQNK